MPKKTVVVAARRKGETAKEKRKQELTELRQFYVAELTSLSESSLANMTHACNGSFLSATSGDSADRREPDDILLRNKLGITTQKRIANIRTAIELIDSGEYGKCESCGKEIPIKRLELAAGTTFCVTCKEEADQSKTISHSGIPKRVDNIQPRHFAQ